MHILINLRNCDLIKASANLSKGTKLSILIRLQYQGLKTESLVIVCDGTEGCVHLYEKIRPHF